MKTKRVLRYYCDFCKKSGCSKSSMVKHEARCTKNPNRECGVCNLLENAQAPMADLKAALMGFIYDENPAFCPNEAETAANLRAMAKLREVAGNCPACIMAAFRQTQIPVPAAPGFDWTSEMKAIWDDINERALENHNFGQFME